MDFMNVDCQLTRMIIIKRKGIYTNLHGKREEEMVSG